MSRLLCLAIAVPDPLGPRLDRARILLHPGKQHMAAHITVLAPARVADEQVPQVVDRVGRACAALPAFCVQLDGAGSFRRRAHAAYLAVTQGADEARRVHEALAQILPAADERTYRPHVTIANRCPAVVLDAAERAFAGFRAEFIAGAVTVFEHGPGGWTPLAVAPLATG